MDKRVKHSNKTRIKAAKLFDAGLTYSEVSREIAIPLYTLRVWQDSHNQNRLIGSGLMKRNRKYSPELKLLAVEKFLAGTRKEDVLIEFSISNRSVFNKWLNLYRRDGAAALQPMPVGRKPKASKPGEETSEEKIERLEMENALLKKYHALMAENAAQGSKRRQSRR